MNPCVLTIAYKGLFASCQEISFAKYAQAYDYLMGEFDSNDAMSAMITQLNTGKATKFKLMPSGRVDEVLPSD